MGIFTGSIEIFLISPFTVPDLRCVCNCILPTYNPEFETSSVQQMQLSACIWVVLARGLTHPVYEMLCSSKMPRLWTETRNSLNRSINFSNCENVTNARGYKWRAIEHCTAIFFLCVCVVACGCLYGNNTQIECVTNSAPWSYSDHIIIQRYRLFVKRSLWRARVCVGA